MNKNEALAIIKRQLPEKRYIHTLGVMETAIRLAEIYNGDVETTLAAIFHDYAKYCPEDEMRQIIIQERMPKDLLLSSRIMACPGWCFLVKKKLVLKMRILNAIKYHTTGGPDILTERLFLADYIERTGIFREWKKSVSWQKDLHLAILKSLQNTIVFSQ